MPLAAFGRTNKVFPPVWLSLAASLTASDEASRSSLVESALAAETVLDISNGPALWGGMMRGTSALVMSCGGSDVDRAVDEGHARNLLEANLIETLSCLGRDYLDFYFLIVRGLLSTSQADGALSALEMARQEGHVRHVGVACGDSALGFLRNHDAFEALLLSDANSSEVAALGRARRLGLLSRSSGLSDGAWLADVRSAADVLAAVGPVGAGR